MVDAGSTLYASDSASVVRSSDWGETWTTAGAPPERAAYVATLDIRQAGHLFAWGRDAATDHAVAWRSVDGGSRWSTIAIPPDFDINPALELEGPDGSVIVAAGRDGISITTGGAWKRLPIT